ncbi:putative D-beta-hydroxybutyrate permease [[Clostridium] ultunense Esp]|uniref:Putative permease n=1 Tax=[Clostridium] ultunense Esp TaxID=1288971 RepID=M1Z7G9_9FIRM|nr:GntP family permease [Schnuerera ultunensis]CCQ98735.1 putative D-beta-hydroxybutyrate permease [[Clostridium] ultunense Esp]SHD75979.1 putative permease [[Clostridium] ultunense Esp]
MLGIIIGLALLMFLAYRGYSIIWVAPITAAVVALSGGLPLLETYKETYMAGFVGFTKSWFPVFMLGAIFGHLMDYTGAAKSIAQWLTKVFGPKRAILGVIIGCAVLTYGGISLFVVVFAMYPLALELFREANISRKLIPGSIALGSFTFTMTAVPGTPQIQNLIPIDYFNTTPTAAPIMGIVATLFMFGLGYAYLSWRERKLTEKGDVFTEPEKKTENNGEHLTDLPNPFIAFLPLLSVILTLNLLKWDIVVALLSGIILSMLTNLKLYKGFTKTISSGATGSITAIINTSAAVGFGSVVRAVPGFQTLTDLVLGIKGSPLISEALAVNILAGATGSASGGMGIALEALGDKYYQLALETGISPEAFHRVASLASGGLDTLPHNGAVLTLLAITGMTHKESYIDICVTSLILPILSSIPAIILASLGIY